MVKRVNTLSMRSPLQIKAENRGAKNRKQAYNHARGSARKRGYDWTWEKLRNYYIWRNPICVLCEERGIIRAGEHIDHIIPIAEAPELRLDEANLRTLCQPCHNRVTKDYHRAKKRNALS